MSDIGLYSGLYETIRRWADLIDDVLLELKAGTTLTRSGSYDTLNKLISGLVSDDIEAVDFSDQRVAAIVESKLGNGMDWRDLSRKLSNATRSSEVVPALEAVAQCLAEKHADTVAKMRRGKM